LLTVVAFTAPASAQVYVRAPFVEVRVGPGVMVRAPFVGIAVYQPPVVRPIQIAPKPVPIPSQAEPLLPPVPVQQAEGLARPIRVETVAPPAVVVPSRAPTPKEFLASFRPAPGAYEVVLQHPFTGQPVKVAFVLPNAQLKKVRVNKLRMEFDYRGKRVVIRFFRDGSVRVRT
jgi:hypothetical protein